jgi:hypothetical protein
MSEELCEIQLHLELLKKDVINTDKQCAIITQKMTSSIEKLQEVNVNVVKMITIHDLKHEQHEKTEEELKEDVKELHSRITNVNRELQDKLSIVENNISGKIDDLKDTLIISSVSEKSSEKRGWLSAGVDKYAYLIVGGFIAVGWVYFHFHDILKLFNLF